MKKTIFVMLLASALICCTFFVPEVVGGFVPSVKTVKLGKEMHYNEIDALGEIENRTKTDITAEVPLIILDVTVNVGDYVEVGDVVCRINRNATMRKLSELQGYSQLYTAAIASQASKDMPISDEQLPEQLVATESGYVSAVNISRGDLLEPDSPAVTTVKSSDLIVKVAVAEGEVPKLEIGQTAIVTGSGFGYLEYTGKVTKVYPEAHKKFIGTAQETVVDVIIELDAPDNAVKAGFTALATIEVEAPKALRTLPYTAIMQDDDGSEYVYIYKSGKAVRQNIVTGRELSVAVEVVSGVRTSDLVIARPSQVQEGEYVRLH